MRALEARKKAEVFCFLSFFVFSKTTLFKSSFFLFFFLDVLCMCLVFLNPMHEGVFNILLVQFDGQVKRRFSEFC